MLATVQSRTFCLLVCCLKKVKIRIYKIIILPVVLYGCKTWSLIFRKEHRLKVSEKRVLRIFGPKRDEVIGGWRKLHNEKLHNLHSSVSIIRMIKSRRIGWAGQVAHMGEKRNKILVGKPKGKRPLRRPMSRCR
jgi:hypothetical protein